jgi:hypothetical protein
MTLEHLHEWFFSFVHHSCKAVCTNDESALRINPFVQMDARLGFSIRALSAQACRKASARAPSRLNGPVSPFSDKPHREGRHGRG